MRNSTPSDSGVAASSPGSEGGPVMRQNGSRLRMCINHACTGDTTKDDEECCRYTAEILSIDAALKRTAVETQHMFLPNCYNSTSVPSWQVHTADVYLVRRIAEINIRPVHSPTYWRNPHTLHRHIRQRVTRYYHAAGVRLSTSSAN